jgi:RNA polymerase sigma-70 factor, ECF subfamily
VSMHRPMPDVTERQLLEAVYRGDEDAFRRLVEPHRPGLRAHCDRMLGTLDDGEDALQDALLRAWRGLGRFEGRSSLRNWLYRIATNASLDARARRAERALPIEDALTWRVNGRDETASCEDGYAAPAARVEQRESAELAVVAALRHLPPRQRAVLILREVLGFSAGEVAQALGTTVAAVNSALQRARKALDTRPRERSQQATMRSPGDERFRAIARNVVDAFERGDVDGAVSLLAEDAGPDLPSYAEWYPRRRRDRWLIAPAPSAATSPYERAKAGL